MLKNLAVILAALAIVVLQDRPSLARGGGGGFRGGGGGFGGYRGGGFGGGGFGGYREGGFGGGGYREGGFGGYREGGFGGGYREGGENAFRSNAGERGEDFRNEFVGNREHANLPSDGGFGRAGNARDFTRAGNFTQNISRGTMQNRARNVRNNFWHHDYFNRNWWNNHPGAWFAAGWGAGAAWDAATWGALGGWYGWGDLQPATYDYGTNVTYQDDEVYYGDAPVASASDYYQQASDIAQSNPASSGPTDSWLPLGVFGLVQGDQTSASAVFQLATNKSGAIQGNFSDMLTGSTLTVHGAVDRTTQRAAWTVGDNLDTVYETGIGNLTKDEAPLLVHFGKDRTQQWMLVRLKQPDAVQTGAATEPPAPSQPE